MLKPMVTIKIQEGWFAVVSVVAVHSSSVIVDGRHADSSWRSVTSKISLQALLVISILSPDSKYTSAEHPGLVISCIS